MKRLSAWLASLRAYSARMETYDDYMAGVEPLHGGSKRRTGGKRG